MIKTAFYIAAALLTATQVDAAPKKVAPRKPVVDLPLEVPLKPVVGSTKQRCTKLLPSGLGIKQLKPGEGTSPASGDFVLVRYVGYLRSNGEVFDQNAQAVFPVDGVIPGFAEGIKQMSKGAIYRLCIPAAIGYGEKGTPDGSIPPNANLGFQVELVDFKSQAEMDAMNAVPELPVDEEPPAAPEPTQEVPQPQ